MPFSDLLIKLSRGEKLSPLELVEFEREAKAVDESKERIKKWVDSTGRNRVDKVDIGMLDTDVPYNRAITYSFISNSPIANDTETYVSLTSSRGYIKQADACVIYKPGTTNQWIRNPVVPESRNILTLVNIYWAASSSSTSINSYIDTFDPDDNYSASGALSYVAGSATNGTSTFSREHDVLLDGWSFKLGVYQDSGGNLAINDINLTFMLA